LRRAHVASADTKNSHGTDRSDPGIPFEQSRLYLRRRPLKPGTFLELANYHVNRRGAKFLNLHYCYRWPEVLARWALQPAFRLAGKVSWDIAAVHATAKLKVTCINPSKRLARRLVPRATRPQR
jgi:hypothetical protein